MEIIFKCSRPGRRGTPLPKCDVPRTDAIGGALRRKQPAELPELTELDVVRHYTNLSRMNMGVDTNFYPLGSCTMKYNPKCHERIAALEGFAGLHPLLPQLRHGGTLTQGALAVLYETRMILSELSGFDDCTMQPMAGAHGELTGVMMIAAYHRSRGEGDQRRVMLIPDTAHGTNPASAAVAGFECVEVATNPETGGVDLDDLASKLSDRVGGLMLTCPNTLGLFNSEVETVCRMVHEAGGLCYCDGANFNAIMGRVRPGDIGFDVMHVNLHKSFATPHGGGGPGAGPVMVKNLLVPFLPVSQVCKRSDGTYELSYNAEESVGYIAPFYGNFGVILKAYAYMLTLGADGFRRVSENAVLNANYLRHLLKDHYAQRFDRPCMHECVFSATRQAANGVRALDIAKALIDRGYHPPTIYFPLIVAEALMIEPTESESVETLEAFAQAMIEIAEQAAKDPESLKNGPFTTPVGHLDETAAARRPVVADL